MSNAALALLAALAGGQQEPVSGTVSGTVRREGTRQVVVGAEVRVEALRRVVRTDSAGRFDIAGVPPGSFSLRVAALRYQTYETTVYVGRGSAVRLDVELAALPQALPDVDVTVAQVAGEARHARDLFEATVLPAVTTISRREMQSLPTIVEPDVMRSLQSVPGGVVRSDMDAQIYVRGGAPDQNLVLIDGARVFGTHHMFGMNGAFNPDAVERVDFYRGGKSPRYSGALSSVIEMEQRDGKRDAAAEGGVSMLGARMTFAGAQDDERFRWMLAGRSTHIDAAVGEVMPYAFRDAHGRLGYVTARGDSLTFSGYGSTDRFRFGGDDDRSSLLGRTSNAVASVRFARRGKSASIASGLWFSHYGAHLNAARDAGASRTENGVAVAGWRLDIQSLRGAFLLRGGTDVEVGSVVLDGGQTHGGFYSGSTTDRFVKPAVHGELEWSAWNWRLVPGVRASMSTRDRGVLVEPRIAARRTMGANTTLTAHLGRSYQEISALRDARRWLGGPNLWFVHPADAPASRSDDASVELSRWFGDRWSANASLYARRLYDNPHWRPEGVRDLSSVSFDDGNAAGLELSARYFGDLLSGWLGYTLSRATFKRATTGEGYDAPWDQRHSLNGALLWRVAAKLHLSTEWRYSSGQSSWPFLGDVVTSRFEPFLGRLSWDQLTPVWSPTQVRHEPYGRVDVGARWTFIVGSALIEPYLSVQNLFGRYNVYGYGVSGYPPRLMPLPTPGFPIPSAGVNVRF